MNVLHVIVITGGSHLSKSYHNVVMQPALVGLTVLFRLGAIQELVLKSVRKYFSVFTRNLLCVLLL